MASIASPPDLASQAHCATAGMYDSQWQTVMLAVERHMAAHAIHPQRCVVVLPYAQLMQAAKMAWMRHASATQVHGAYLPRFETTMNWANTEAAAQGLVHQDDAIRFDMACDLLTAGRWLDQAGLSGQREALAPMLLQAAYQLASVAAAQAPQRRSAWGAQARVKVAQGMDTGLLAYEAAVARIALEWALASGYATDLLFGDTVATGVDGLVVVQGFQPDPLALSLQEHWGERGICVPLAPVRNAVEGPTVSPAPSVQLHACADAGDEAARAAACIVRHLRAGRSPVALVANDRVLTRRLRAQLDGLGIAVRDETGWKLSTTHAAAVLMAVLKAANYQASSDAVLDAAKHMVALPRAQVDALEAALRLQGCYAWRSFAPAQAQLAEVAARINAWRSALQQSRALPAWLDALRSVLEECGLWSVLQADAAGVQIVQALYLEPGASNALPPARRAMGLADCTRWVNAVLEADSFKPLTAGQVQVTILPLSQLLGRHFAAVVVPGCDEVHMPAAPEPPGQWNSAQRAALGLPTRLALQAAQLQACAYLLQGAYGALGGNATVAPSQAENSAAAADAMAVSAVDAALEWSNQAWWLDLLWRRQEGGEAVLPNAWVQELLLQGWPLASDPRIARSVRAQPTNPPQPTAQALVPSFLSASAYGDLRACPYRYFALRCMGLAPADELEEGVDKRDFGTWLHLVLRIFHQTQISEQKGLEILTSEEKFALINRAAEQASEELALDASAFTPFAAAWPQVRDGYLAWLAKHEASGARFATAESWHEREAGIVRLRGQIDRTDTLASGERLLLDYKTESLQKTKDRMKAPDEDSQLAFYAALLGDSQLQAAYLNVAEKGGTELVPLADIEAARDQLLQGIDSDMRRIAQGQPLPALGEGSACEYCAARGLCRKDFWL